MRTNHLSGLALGAILAAGSPAWSQHLALVVKSTSPHSWAMKRMVLEDVLAPASVPTLQARRVRLPVADDQEKKESKESPKAGPSAVTNSSRAWAPGETLQLARDEELVLEWAKGSVPGKAELVLFDHLKKSDLVIQLTLGTGEDEMSPKVEVKLLPAWGEAENVDQVVSQPSYNRINIFGKQWLSED